MVASAPRRRQPSNTEVWCAVAFTATCALLAAACATPGKGATPIVSGEVIRGDKGGYELRVPNGEWSKVAPGTLNPESPADLELVRSANSAWLHVKRTSGSAMRIEQFVYGRRSQFLAG